MISLRCTAPHPNIPGVRCKARLCDIAHGAMAQLEASEDADKVPKRAISLKCPRHGCDALYHITLRQPPVCG